MNNRIPLLITLFVLLLSLPVWAGVSGADQAQARDQIKLLDRNQLQDQTGDHVRLQLRDRIQISDSAKAQMQERKQMQEEAKTGISFTDIQTHWAKEQISSAYNWGFINGYQDGSFQPDGAISGVEGIIMASRMMNCTSNEEDAAISGPAINWDAIPVWARETVREQAALRIASQCQFYGEEQLNRLQFAVMLAKACKLDSIPTGDDAVFLDQENIPAEDLGYIHSLQILGVIEGSNGNFIPDKPVSRAEAASMLVRLMNSLE